MRHFPSANLAMVNLLVNHLADSVEQLGAVFKKLLRLILLAVPVVMPYIVACMSHSRKVFVFMICRLHYYIICNTLLYYMEYVVSIDSRLSFMLMLQIYV